MTHDYDDERGGWMKITVRTSERDTVRNLFNWDDGPRSKAHEGINLRTPHGMY